MLRSTFLMMVNVLVYLRHAPLLAIFVRNNRYLPNVANPRRYNEKMFWRKVFDRNPTFVDRSDKLASKEYVAKTTPSIRCPATLWTGTVGAEIPDEAFEHPVVVKANHGCRLNVFAENGRPAERDLERLVDRWLARPWGRRLAEWAYEDVPRRIYVEELLMEGAERSPMELRIRVFHERAESCAMVTHRWTGLRIGRYDRDGGMRAPLPNDKPQPDEPLPECYSDAIRAAEELAAGLDHLRCDFFVIGGQLYFNEFAVYPASGIRPGADLEPLTEHWDLQRSWLMTTPQSGWRKIYAAVFRAEG